MRINLSKLALTSVAIFLLLASCATDNAQRINKDILKGWLGNPQVEIIDVRANKDWVASDKKIRGAVREDPGRVAAWMNTLPKDKKIVLY
jgi:rhodanese-related sulfurtransferase